LQCRGQAVRAFPQYAVYAVQRVGRLDGPIETLRDRPYPDVLIEMLIELLMGLRERLAPEDWYRLDQRAARRRVRRRLAKLTAPTSTSSPSASTDADPNAAACSSTASLTKPPTRHQRPTGSCAARP
jgi:hypothetical protein